MKSLTKQRQNKTTTMHNFINIILFLGAFATSSVMGQKQTYNVPSFTITDLKDGSNSEQQKSLLHALGTTGLLAIKLDGEREGRALERYRSAAFDGLCKCASSPSSPTSSGASTPLLSVPGADSAMLSGSTTRTTLATATVGHTPLPLPVAELSSSCGTETFFTDSLEGLRDVVADATSAFLRAVDAIIEESAAKEESEGTGTGRHALLKTSSGASYNSLSDITGASRNLEHFHVYSRDGDVPSGSMRLSGDDDDALRLHTDAGLFLSFIPALSCQNNGAVITDQSFYVLDPEDGETKTAIFPTDSPTVAIMLGVGAESWLDLSDRTTQYDQSLKLRATKHKVNMNQGEQRAWYGMMHLVPDNAIVQVQPQRTFSDMRKFVANRRSIASRRFGDDDDEAEPDVAIGCGISDNKPVDATSIVTRTHRRRLQHVVDGSACNNVTNFYCWMICQEIPDAENAASRLEEGQSLYCLDPAVLGAGDNIEDAVMDCVDYRGVPGAAENPGCVGSWQPNTASLPSQQFLNLDQSYVPVQEEKYCYGSTSMYMHGFEWQSTTCVAYLFQSWVLNTPGKFAAAAIGTLFFGVLLEGSIYLRRTMIAYVDAAVATGGGTSGASGWKHTAISASTYMVQLTLGYLIMLVVMTYSAPLFISVIVGLVGGHIIFTTLRKRKERSCHCAENAAKAAAAQEPTTTYGNSLKYVIPQGSTPCCMNDMQEDNGVFATNPLPTPADEEEENECCCPGGDEDVAEEDFCNENKEGSAPTSCCSGTASDSV